MFGLDPSVQAAIATGIFAIIGTYLSVKYKDVILQKPAKPKDRMDTIFDGYENLIKQQQIEINRKGLVISSLEDVIDRLEQELTVTRKLLTSAREELEMATSHSADLRQELVRLKREYSETLEKEKNNGETTK